MRPPHQVKKPSHATDQKRYEALALIRTDDLTLVDAAFARSFSKKNSVVARPQMVMLSRQPTRNDVHVRSFTAMRIEGVRRRAEEKNASDGTIDPM